MISSEKQLERALSHYTTGSTKRAAILSAVQRGITSRPDFVHIAIDELAEVKKFGAASRMASSINEHALAEELMDKQHKANAGEVMRKQEQLRKLDEQVSGLTEQEKTRAMIDAVKNGITHNLIYIRLVISGYELVGPGMFKESEKLAMKVGARISQECEEEGWIGLAAHMSESEGSPKRTAELYGKYATKLEEQGKFGLAAEVVFYKLGDIDRAIMDGKKAGSWELVAEWLRRKGDEEGAKTFGKLASMARK